ncbi:MAG: energy transducer TonB [Campylobacterales bacterium]|nr:energy transducer TonB [Campylobacterales bacterium]
METIISLNREAKGLAISLIAHAIVIGFFLFEFNQPHKAISQPQVITMDLTLLAPPKEEPKPTDQPKVPQEMIKKIEPQPKIEEPIISNKANPIQPAKKTEPVREIQKTATPKAAVQTKTEYKKTNFEMIRDMVLSHLKYPSIAKRMYWSGTATVKLTIDSDGNLIGVSLIESSGRQQLDDAALSAARAIKGDNIPKPSETTDILLPILFNLE